MVVNTLLVANRGEIARRIFRTARQMGYRCVAVYSAADADAPFVHEADEAIALPGGYLDGADIVAAALATGADAIHPGYGYLSENATFAQTVLDAGLVWVGPSPEVIAAMGDKLAAKAAAVAAGVPVLPSTIDPARAADIGFPVLVKASAGGGGKGMRIVSDPADLDDAVAAARREAASAFGDDTVYLERYVARSRHVEIQILGDTHGNVVHLGERECSIQRRHQKIVEESPSPVIDAAMREAMGAAALGLARSVGYSSAGTVEFLVDDATREFFFLEVNTRLQVEHPVTEMVTGIDLVREQLRIAAGSPLGYGQDAVTMTGHAIEVRLYAEDPEAGFLPATGTLAAFEPSTDQVRWDSGVERGSVVGLDFDPMLAKVIAHAPTRAEAAGRLAGSLERTHLGGVTTNRDFLAAVLRRRAFAEGDTTTDFIERHAPGIALDDGDSFRAAIAAVIWRQCTNRRADDRWGFAPSGWRNGGLPPQALTVDIGDRSHSVRYRRRRDGTFQIIDGPTVVIHGVTETVLALSIDGRRWNARVTDDGDEVHVQLPRTTVTVTVQPRFRTTTAAGPADGGLVAPMPGRVLEVRVAVGDTVDVGAVLLVLEAMKMEHHIKAPHAGTVAAVAVTVGDQVDRGTPLVTIADLSADAPSDADAHRAETSENPR